MTSIPCGNEGCNAQSLGSLIDGLLIRFAEIALFPPAATDAERKAALLAAFDSGELTERQTAMLMAAYSLRDA